MTIEGLSLPTVEELEAQHAAVSAEIGRCRRLRKAIEAGAPPGIDLPTPEALKAREENLAGQRAKLARLVKILRD